MAVSPGAMAIGKRLCATGVPSAFWPVIWYGTISSAASSRRRLVEVHLEADVRARHAHRRERPPVDLSVIDTAPRPEQRAGGVLDLDDRRRPEAVLVEREAVDRRADR